MIEIIVCILLQNTMASTEMCTVNFTSVMSIKRKQQAGKEDLFETRLTV